MEIVVNGKKVLNFCANNYLGLSNDPRVVKAAKDTMDTHGFGMSSVRFICGTQDIHKKLEADIASFHKLDDCILYPSGFDSNAGFFEALLGPEDAIISDALNHASLIDGIRLCKAKRFRYNHLDMAHLEQNLKEATEQGARLKAIVTDGVFSMDGDIAPLDEIVALAKKYDAFTMVDECHATGIFGKSGRGTPEMFNLEGQVDVISSTLGKALGGGTGGYTAASKEIVEVLRNKGRPYLFSNSIAPPIVGASIEVMKILGESNELIDKLHSNTARFRKGIKQSGFTVSGHDLCPIAPVMLGDAKLAADISDELMNHNIYVIGFSYPVVPKGQARIRT
jgi:glycine C-acetyltransferase